MKTQKLEIKYEVEIPFDLEAGKELERAVQSLANEVQRIVFCWYAFENVVPNEQFMKGQKATIKIVENE